MGVHHCEPGEVINLLNVKGRLPEDATVALFKTEGLEAMRMVLPNGKMIPKHQVAGAITVQCVSGRVAFVVDGEPRELKVADWLYLAPHQQHSLHALVDSVLLVTRYLKH